MIQRKQILVAYAQSLGSLNRFVLWVPLFLYFVFKLAVIFSYMGTSRGALSSFWGFFIESSARDALAHYPWTFRFMPIVLGNLDIFLDIFVHIIFQGATIVLYAAVLDSGTPNLGTAFRLVRSKYLPVVGVSCIVSVLLYVWFRLPIAASLPLPSIASNGVVVAGGLIIQALFIYTMPLILLRDHSFAKSLTVSFSTAIRRSGGSFLLVALPFIITIPTVFLAMKSSVIVSRLSPEVVVHIQIAQELTRWLSTLVLLGGLTALFIKRS